MTISLLNAVKSAMGESGIEVPANVIANLDQTMRYIADAAATELRQWGWQRLIKSTTITMTTATDYALPADFWAYVPDTLWANGGSRPVNMPTTPSTWTIIKSGMGLNPGQFNCRFIGNRLEVQNPTDGTTLRLEYVQRYPITSADGVTYREAFTADTDLFILDERMFVLDLKWRLKKEKGLDDWQFDKQAFEQYRKFYQGVNAGAQTLHQTGNRRHGPCPPYANDWVP